MTAMSALVAIVMGSQSDWETLAHASQTLDAFAIVHDVRVLSAHRTPDQLVGYVEAAERDGVEVFIAGAGGAAALPGTIAAKTTLPVLGVPIESKLSGLDSLLSMVQMPAGVPVGTLAVGRAGAVNAALLAVSILAVKRPELRQALRSHRDEQAQRVLAQPDPRRATRTSAAS
jgi:5-(carboxyamino)imidazole ribonucleotide mutase